MLATPMSFNNVPTMTASKSWLYFDPEYETMSSLIDPPRVVIDNESEKDVTLVKCLDFKLMVEEALTVVSNYRCRSVARTNMGQNNPSLLTTYQVYMSLARLAGAWVNQRWHVINSSKSCSEPLALLV